MNKNFSFELKKITENRDRFAPSPVIIVKDNAGFPNVNICALRREVQLPFQQVLDTLMGPSGTVVVYDVRELLYDIDRLKQMVLDIVNCCSQPLTYLGSEQAKAEKYRLNPPTESP